MTVRDWWIVQPRILVAPDSGPSRTARRERSRGFDVSKLAELWCARELVVFFVWRELKVRYRQTLLGVAWALLQPVLTVTIFSIVFGRLAKLPSDDLPYTLFCLAGVVPWTFFATGLTQGANSLVAGANMVRKIYFPRLSLPLSAVLAGGLDLAFAFALLIVLVPYYDIVLTVAVLSLPLILVMLLVTTLGVAFWLSAVNVRYRDVRYALPFLLQIWLFATPVVYPSSLLPEPWRTLYGINPMASVVEALRWAILGGTAPSWSMLLLSGCVSLLLLVSGALYFWRTEQTMADMV
jgi:lipopolysaccharide transport system permease protein